MASVRKVVSSSRTLSNSFFSFDGVSDPGREQQRVAGRQPDLLAALGVHDHVEGRDLVELVVQRRVGADVDRRVRRRPSPSWNMSPLSTSFLSTWSSTTTSPPASRSHTKSAWAVATGMKLRNGGGVDGGDVEGAAVDRGRGPRQRDGLVDALDGRDPAHRLLRERLGAGDEGVGGAQLVEGPRRLHGVRRVAAARRASRRRWARAPARPATAAARNRPRPPLLGHLAACWARRRRRRCRPGCPGCTPSRAPRGPRPGRRRRPDANEQGGGTWALLGDADGAGRCGARSVAGVTAHCPSPRQARGDNPASGAR